MDTYEDEIPIAVLGKFAFHVSNPSFAYVIRWKLETLLVDKGSLVCNSIRSSITVSIRCLNLVSMVSN